MPGFVTLSYVIERRAELDIEGKRITWELGDPWVEPKSAKHTYVVSFVHGHRDNDPPRSMDATSRR